MKNNGKSVSDDNPRAVDGITRIRVRGYKSLEEDLALEVRPLTVLAGANSSGKSSVMQPLLLMKQTLEASFDPGALLLDGPNLRFSSAEQLFSRRGATQKRTRFSAGFDVNGLFAIKSTFNRMKRTGVDVTRVEMKLYGKNIDLAKGMSLDEIYRALEGKRVLLTAPITPKPMPMEVIRDRCFLSLGWRSPDDGIASEFRLLVKDQNGDPFHWNYKRYVNQIIHLPGLRGNPARNYPVTAVTGLFPGTFEKYTASVIENWQSGRGKSEQIEALNRYLRLLGLTWKVMANRINDAQVELLVGRLRTPAQGGAHDLVSIADVGFGVSQCLPVLVALLTAQPGQLVYLEQPEIHLHPRAQTALAQVLADAARRGVRVVVETHSDLLLLGIQTVVARGGLSPALVKFHWFERLNDGSSRVTSADLDENGTFGDWPEDFAEVRLKAESQFLDAALRSEAE